MDHPGPPRALTVAFDVRSLRRGFVLGGVMMVLTAVGLAFTGSATARVVLGAYAVLLVACLILLRLRLRVARGPQVVADESGIVIATYRGPLRLAWSEVQEIGPIKVPGLVGYRSPTRKSWLDRVLIAGDGRFFYVKTGTHRPWVSSPPADQGLSLEDVRSELERMWRAFGPGGGTS